CSFSVRGSVAQKRSLAAYGSARATPAAPVRAVRASTRAALSWPPARRLAAFPRRRRMTKAIVLSREGDQFRAETRSLTDAELETATPGDDVWVDVEYSTINYKDGLALTDGSPVVRKWPMVPGIDAAGIVKRSEHPRWKPGDRVVINGWGLGETHWGGLAQRARVKGDWLIGVPASYTTRDAMAIGTAGYTAALAVLSLQAHAVTPSEGEIVVTGATGGVGSIGVALRAWR